MDSPSPIPFRAAAAASAYGIKPKQAAAPFNQPNRTSAFQPPQQPASTDRSAISRSTDRSAISRLAATGLVAARVEKPITRDSFDASPGAAASSPSLRAGASATPALGSGPLQMYSRAADRVEVATAVQLGRLLDAKA